MPIIIIAASLWSGECGVENWMCGEELAGSGTRRQKKVPPAGLVLRTK